MLQPNAGYCQVYIDCYNVQQPASRHVCYPHTHTFSAQPIAPAITTHPSDIIVIEGKPALLSCSANGEPPPLITWQLDDSLVVISSQVTIANTSGGTSELRVASVTMENLGTYRCMATNSEGTASSSSAELIIASECELHQGLDYLLVRMVHWCHAQSYGCSKFYLSNPSPCLVAIVLANIHD